MRSKILECRKTLAILVGSRHYAAKPAYCNAHMNDLPVPCKPWQPWYNERQSFYNKHLAVGIVWFAFSVIMALSTDCMYLNWAPPAQPAPPSDMADECGDGD